MSKVYRGEGGCFGKRAQRAVDDLSFDAQQNGITSLLGHNGAGKTTTIGVLTGLLPPTEGTAYVWGRDVRTSITAIREGLGICPQHNVLFESLTVEEHMVFCARLRCIPPKQLDRVITKYLRDVDLEAKRGFMASKLSGGQKRKLSVAMAFLCGGEAVILDEPTAGMDPRARRATWDLLLRYKKTRTILLCTHHLDEADLLSDHICMIANGRLQCTGSPLFLKRAFNASYVVTFEVDRTRAETSHILSVVAGHIPGATVADDVGQEISVRLPREQTARFPAL